MSHGSSSHPVAATNDSYSMQTQFHNAVTAYISSSQAPKWNDFLSLIDQLVVRFQQKHTRAPCYSQGWWPAVADPPVSG